ncbi:MAG: hypothetical protein WC615_11810 [Mucilaginibacter sp.]|jgi:hypothetical protein|uniref:hypothetical protein n=1 Tax=Mucilaginibacter sp. TaxID=1882438 RepID=UPI0035631C0A
MYRLLIILLFIITKAYGQNPQLPKRDSSITADDLGNLTVMLYQPLSNSMGTGTIIKHNNLYYLLTASHVAKLMHESAKIIFHVGEDMPGILDLVMLTKHHELQWLHHPIADLSIIQLIPFNEDTRSRLAKTSFPSSWILPSNVGISNIGDGFDFTYLGYPIVELELKHFSALIFHSKRTSGLITQNRLEQKNIKCDFYFLDKPSMQGCSGSGVYISVRNSSMYTAADKTYLVGVIHGTQGDDTGGKLAMITPSMYIYDLLAQLH